MNFEIGKFLKREYGFVLHRMTTTEERERVSHENDLHPALLRSVLNGNRRITEGNVILLKELAKLAKARNKIYADKFA